MCSNDNSQIQPTDSQIVLYQPDETISLEVKLESETVWLTQQQMVELFCSSKANVSEHIANIFQQGELTREATVRNFRTVRKEGNRMVTRNLDYYNLDMIISVGFRVNTQQGIRFRQWANQVLKEYLLRGYAVHQQMLLMEQRIDAKLLIQHDEMQQIKDTQTRQQEQLDFYIRMATPPAQGIFYDGQIYDAYTFVSDLIKSAKTSILLIDNYVDDTVLTLLDKRSADVTATIYTQQISRHFRLDLERHNAQYAPIEARTFRQSHDRFLCIDAAVYHIGASIKDLGKRWCAFSRMEILTPDELIARLPR
jgi:hypothetical protein